LYLGFAFPPGVAALHPGLNPAGHALETRMMAELRRCFEIRSSGLLPLIPSPVANADPTSGVPHDLLLLDKPPELLYRYCALGRLKDQYRRWRVAGWEPDLVLVYNLSPVYNQFLLWLRRQKHCPRLVLILLDSSSLGQQQPWLKRFRRRLKPMFRADAEMVSCFDACVGFSQTAEQHIRPSGMPFLWMPGGCDPSLVCAEPDHSERSEGQLRLGYFGALGDHAGVKGLVDVFLSTCRPVTLEICGYGKRSAELITLAQQQERLKFRGLLSPAECLRFGRSCDGLINPRPASHGNENNFASKLFDYALCGRAILTSRLSGVEQVLGPEAFYFDPHDFAPSLRQQLEILCRTSRGELDRRGAAIQHRVATEFSWQKQGARLACFLQEVRAGNHVRKAVPEALAA
jgi:hypothetical protein